MEILVFARKGEAKTSMPQRTTGVRGGISEAAGNQESIAARPRAESSLKKPSIPVSM